MKKKHLIALGILATGILLAVILISSRDQPERVERKATAPLVSVTGIPVKSGNLTVVGTGTVQAAEETELAVQVAGRVVSVNPQLRPGGRVEKGEVLLRLDPSDFNNAVAQARAEVAEAEVGVLQAEEESELARREFERYQSLNDSTPTGTGFSEPGNISQSSTDDSESDTQQERPSDAQASALTLREPQRQAAKAALERARARAEDARLALSRTRLTAPYDGYVRSESVSEGDYLTPGRSIGRLYASDRLEVLVPLTASQAARIPGLWNRSDDGDTPSAIPAEVVMEYGDQSYRWQAEVSRVQAELDAASRTLDVILTVPDPFSGGMALDENSSDPAPPLLVGTFVDVRLQGKHLDRYLQVPRNAVRTDDELWWVDDRNQLQILPVTTVQALDNELIVTGDFPEQSSLPVVVSDLRAATRGMQVRPQPLDSGNNDTETADTVSLPEVLYPEVPADAPES